MTNHASSAAHRALPLCLFFALSTLLCGQGPSQDPETRVEARKKLAYAREQMAQGKYDLGGKTLQELRDAYTASGQSAALLDVGFAAWLDLVKHHFDTVRDLDSARIELTRLLAAVKNHADAEPEARVIEARMALAAAASSKEVEERVIPSFEKVLAYYAKPADQRAWPQALFHLAEANRAIGKREAALVRYRQLLLESPRSPVAASARLAMAACLLPGKWWDAMVELQRVRAEFPDTPEAAQAAAWNAILYRLYVKPNTEAAPFAFAPERTLPRPPGVLEEVRGMAFDVEDRLHIATAAGVLAFDWRKPPTETRLAEIQGLFLGIGARPFVVQKGVLRDPAGETYRVTGLGAREVNDISGAAVSSSGDFLVADPAGHAVLRFSRRPFAYRGNLVGGITPAAIAVDGVGNLAVLERDSRQVVVFNRFGEEISRLQRGNRLEEPVDLHFDALGHLYVLDRGTRPNALSVFHCARQPDPLIMVFSINETQPGSLRRATRFALDSTGALFVYDERARHVQVYQ